MTMPYVTEDNLTDVALERWKDIPDSRLRQIMQSLIKHVHGFSCARSSRRSRNGTTAIDWLTRTGKLCSQKRQEFILASDVLGVSMLVDAINNRRPSGATPSGTAWALKRIYPHRFARPEVMNQIAVINQAGKAHAERIIVLPAEEFDTLVGRPGYHERDNGDLERREGSLVYLIVRQSSNQALPTG